MSIALKRFREEFSYIADDCELHHDLFQRFHSKQQDQEFDIFFTRGVTIELVHPSFDIVQHTRRITKTHVILMIEETGQGFPRFYIHEFAKHGFVLINALRPISQKIKFEPEPICSLLVFQRGDISVC